MKLLIFFLINVLFSLRVSAQSITTVTGKVVNAQQEALWGNVMFVSASDLSLINGAPFREGHFELSVVDRQQLLLRFTSLGYQDAYRTLAYQGHARVDLGEIVLQEAISELDEVVVEARRSLAQERRDGSLAITVANTPLATSTSVDELLSRAPGVVYDADGQIEIFGKGAAIIFIDGLRVSTDRLSTLSPALIETIEIISNPGPRYDAEGNAVINIVTKRDTHEGGQGTLKNYFTYGNFAGYDNRTSADYRYAKGVWSLNANYGLQVGNDRMTLATTRVRSAPDALFSSDLTTDWQYKYDNFSNYGLGLQYQPHRNRYLSVQYTGAHEKQGGNQLSKNTIVAQEIGRYTSNLALNELSANNIINVNYGLETDSAGTTLFLGGQYASYERSFDNDIRESSSLAGAPSSARINNTGTGDIQIVSVQADYGKRFGGGSVLEAGAKLGYVTNRSLTTFWSVSETGTRMRNNDLSNDFTYEERVPAGYVNFRDSLTSRIDYHVGIRAELTDYALRTSVNNGTTLGDRYLNAFPSASLTATWSDDATTFFSYAARINRPAYQALNPFVIYQDAFTSIRGNPNLQPAKVHALEAGATLSDWSLKVGYNYTIDPMDGGAFQSPDDPRVYVLQGTNLSRKHAYFASLSRSIHLPWWRSANTASVSYDRALDDTGVFGINTSEPYYYLYSQNSFAVNDGLTIHLSGWYLSDKQDGINSERNYSSVNLGVEKKLLQGALTGHLEANDIFHRVRAAGAYRLGATDIVYGRKFNTNYVRFTVSYRFGRLAQSRYRNQDVGAAETQRAR